MSFSTLYHEISLNKDQLLNLFLGQGDLLLTLYNQKPITIKEFCDRSNLRHVDEVMIHEAKIHGQSEDPNLSHVDGKVTITPM